MTATITPPSDARRRGWCPGALRPMASGDGLLVRIKPSCGILSLDQADAIAALAGGHGNGLIELTSRGNLQLRGVTADTLSGLTSALDVLGLLDLTPEAEAVRNVISTPLAGIDPAAFDTRDIVRALERALVAASDLAGLSDKFGFAVDGGGALPLAEIDTDIVFRWAGAAFAVGLARDDGYDWIGTCTPEAAPATALALARAVLAQAPAARRLRHADPATRQRITTSMGGILQPISPASQPPTPPASGRTTSTPPPPSFRRRPEPTPASASAPSAMLAASDATSMAAAERPAATSTVDITLASGIADALSLPPPSFRRRPEPTPASASAPSAMLAASDATSMTGVEHCEADDLTNNGAQATDVHRVAGIMTIGAMSVVGIGLPFGGTTATALAQLLRQARRAGATEVRLTPWRLLLVAVRGAVSAANVRHAAASLGFITTPDDPRRAVAACPGAPACANGSTPVRADADCFATAAAAILAAGATMHVSGCAKGCARRRPATVTLVADAGRYGLVVNATAAAAPSARYTAAEAAETLARLASAMTKAGDASKPCTAAALQAALKEIEAA